MSSTPGPLFDQDPWPVPAPHDLVLLDAFYTDQWLEVHVGLEKSGHRNLGASIIRLQLFIDADRNPSTGDTYYGWLSGFEFRLDSTFYIGQPQATLWQLPDGVNEGQYFQNLTRGPGYWHGRPEISLSDQLPKQPEHYDFYHNDRYIDVFKFYIPLAIHAYDGAIVDLSDIDVVAVAYPHSFSVPGWETTVGHGDRLPEFGVFNTGSRTWQIREQPSQIQAEFDLVKLGHDFGIGLERLYFQSYYNQIVIIMNFNESLSDLPQFSLLFDTDRSLATGQMPMGASVPTFGGDVRIDFNMSSGYPRVRYYSDGDTTYPAKELGKGQGTLDDFRWNISENTISFIFSKSLLDPYIIHWDPLDDIRLPQNVDRVVYQSEGPLISIVPFAWAGFGMDPELRGSVLDTATGELVLAKKFLPKAEQIFFYELNPYMPKLDIQEFSYSVQDDNLIMRVMIGQWPPYENVNVYFFLDTDRDALTGQPVGGPPAGGEAPDLPLMGADYVVEVSRFRLLTTMKDLVIFNDLVSDVATRQDAWAFVLPTAGPYQHSPGFVTLTVPLSEIKVSSDQINIGIATATEAFPGQRNFMDARAVTVNLGPLSAPPIENQPPIARGDVFYARYGITIGDANVLANDEDSDGDPITVISYGYDGPGELTVYTSGNFEYTPAPGFVGVDTFTYTIADSFGADATATVSLEVPNQPPIARDDFFTARFGIAMGEANFLTNDEDPDGDSIKAVTYSYDGVGQLTLYTNGNFIYTPAAGFFGVDTFTYTIEDSFGAQDSATVNIYVPEHLTVGADGVIPVPGAVDGPRELVRHPFVATLDIDVTGDGTVDAWVALDGEFQGRLLVEADEGATTLRFDGGLGTLVQGTEGPDLLVGRDGHNVFRPGLGVDQMAGVGGRNLYYGTLAEHDGNRILDFGPDDVIRITDRALTPDQVTINDGPDGVVLEIGVPGQVDAAITLDGPFEPGWFTLATGAGFSKIAFVADAPADADASGPVFQAIENLSFAVLGPAAAGDGTGGSPVLVAGPAHGAVTLDGDGRFTYDPDPDFFGLDAFVFRIDDGFGGADETTVMFQVLRDQDGDGVPDIRDNAILAHNPDQRDTDGDGYGNVVDPDFDNDGFVGPADVAYMASVFGTNDALADLTGDGFVGPTDVAILAALFGGPPGPSYIDFLPPADDTLLV